MHHLPAAPTTTRSRAGELYCALLGPMISTCSGGACTCADRPTAQIPRQFTRSRCAAVHSPHRFPASETSAFRRYLGWKSLFPQDLLDQERIRAQARQLANHIMPSLRVALHLLALAVPAALAVLASCCVHACRSRCASLLFSCGVVPRHACRFAACQADCPTPAHPNLPMSPPPLLSAAKRGTQHDELISRRRPTPLVLDSPPAAAASSRRLRRGASAAGCRPGAPLRRFGPHSSAGARLLVLVLLLCWCMCCHLRTARDHAMLFSHVVQAAAMQRLACALDFLELEVACMLKQTLSLPATPPLCAAGGAVCRRGGGGLPAQAWPHARGPAGAVLCAMLCCASSCSDFGRLNRLACTAKLQKPLPACCKLHITLLPSPAHRKLLTTWLPCSPHTQMYGFGLVSCVVDNANSTVKAQLGGSTGWATVSLEQLLAEHQKRAAAKPGK